MERLIQISKRQHDAIQELAASMQAQQEQIATVAKVIVMGADEHLSAFAVIGARVVDGVPVLAIDVPDPAPMP